MFNSYDRNDLILFQEQLYTMAKLFFKLKQTVSEARVNSQVSMGAYEVFGKNNNNNNNNNNKVQNSI